MSTTNNNTSFNLTQPTGSNPGLVFSHIVGEIEAEIACEIISSSNFGYLHAYELITYFCDDTLLSDFKRSQLADLYFSFKADLALEFSELCPIPTTPHVWFLFLDFIFRNAPLDLSIELKHGWQSYLLTNGGMHSANGNIVFTHFVDEFEADIIFEIITEDYFRCRTAVELLVYLRADAELSDADYSLLMKLCFAFKNDYSIKNPGAYLVMHGFHVWSLFLSYVFTHAPESLAAELKHGWQSYLLTNGGMHAANGNIDDFNAFDQEPFAPADGNINMFQIVAIQTTIHFEFSITNAEATAMLLVNNPTPWMFRYIHDKTELFFNRIFFFQEDYAKEFYSKPNVHKFYHYIHFLMHCDHPVMDDILQQGWQSFLLTNGGMHAANGNIPVTPVGSPSRKKVFASPKYRKDFHEWFVLNSDDSNLCTLVNAWCKKLERHFRNIRDESGDCTDFKIIYKHLESFSKYRSTLDPSTINRVEEYLLFSKDKVVPQMGLFDFNVNVQHSVPAVENFGNTLYNSLPESARIFDDFGAQQLLQLGLEPTLWMIASFIVYGIANYNSSVGISYKRILLTMIPFISLFNIVRGSTEILSLVGSFRESLILSMHMHNHTQEHGVPDMFKTQPTHHAGSDGKHDITMHAVPQMDVDSLVDTAGLLYAALSFKIFGLKTPESALKQLSSFWHARPAIEDAIVKITSLIESFVNSFVVEYTDHKTYRFLSSRSSIFKTFESECDGLFTAYNRNELVPTITLYNQVKTLESRMKIEYAKMSKDKSLTGTVRLFYAEIQKVETIRIFIEKRTSSSLSLRQEPVVIMFRGPPGTGKSLSTQYLAHDCASFDCTPSQAETLAEQPLAFQFVRIVDPFWTGYRQDTKVTIFDDFDQIKDCLGVANSGFMEFIRCGSSASYPCPMAHLEEKGGVFFRSKFMVCNTNSVTFDPQSIRSKEAIDRRVDLNYLVVPRLPFCTEETIESVSPFSRRLDKDKLPKDPRGMSIFVPHAQDFYLTDEKGNLTNGVAYSYDQILETCKATFEKKTAWHESQLTQFRKRITREEFDALTDSNASVARETMEEITELDPDTQIKHLEFIDKTYRTIFGSENDSSIALEILYDTYTVEFVDEAIEQFVLYDIITDFPPPENSVIPIEDFEFSISRTLQGFYTQAVSMFNKGSEYFRSFVRFVCSDAFAKFAAIVALLAGVYGLCSYFSKDPAVPQSIPIGHKGGGKQNQKVHVGKNFKTLLKEKIVPQIGGGTDPSGSDLMRSIARKNVFIVEYESGYETNKFVKAGMAVALKGRFVLMHYHFITKLAQKILEDEEYALAKIRFQIYGADSYILEFRVTDVLSSFIIGDKDPQIQGKDLAIVEMPADFQPRSDIIKNFALRKDYNQFKRNIPFMLLCHNGVTPDTQTGLAVANDQPVPVSCEWTDDWVIRDGYSYNSQASAGDCGSLFCVLNPGIQGRKIFGLHVAGVTKTPIGYAESICQEEIEAKMLELGCVHPEIISETTFAVPELGTFIEQPQFNVIGRLDPSEVPKGDNRSSIIKSILYDKVYEHTCIPAKLRPFIQDGVAIDPMEKAKAKMCANTASVPHVWAEAVVETVFNNLELVSKFDVDRRLFTEEEILYGIPGESSVRGANTSTSPGYPDVLLPKSERMKLKIFSFEKDSPENLSLRAEFQIGCLEREKLLQQGIRPVYLFIGDLKDEKKVIAKALEGKTRWFQIGPFNLFYDMKKYFGAFASWISLNRINNGITGGINVFSEEWHLLALKLASPGNPENVGAGDFSAYDGSHLAIFIWFVCREINKWYDDGNDLVRFTLILEVINARIVLKDLVVELSHGMPSGNFLTFLLNSILNHVYHVGAFNLAGGNLLDFYKEIYLAVHGDDSTFKVSELWKDRFNEHTLEPLMFTMGLKYTSELKGVSDRPLRRLDEINYLKRSFKFDKLEMKYIAPMFIEAFMEPLNWSKRGEFFNITIQNIDSALRELSLHDIEIFKKYQKALIAASKIYLSGAEFPRSLHMSYSQWREVTLNSEYYV